MQQKLILEATLNAYEKGCKENVEVYRSVATDMKVNPLQHEKPVGVKGQLRNVFHRQVRFAQQTLKQKGWLHRLDRGHWSITREGKYALTRINVDKYMIAFSSNLGVAMWGDAKTIFSDVIKDDIHLCLTSPPYLGIARSYGTQYDEKEYIDFVISVLSPIRERMLPGANLVLNMSNDSVLKKQFGSRSLYLEKLTLRIAEELELSLMDRLVWHAADKPPKGYQVTHRRTHLTSRYEPLLWFCSEPEACFADNRRVLKPYKTAQRKLVDNGGERYFRKEADYLSATQKGGFSRDNGGSIPSNVLEFATRCESNRGVIRYARDLKLPAHGALYPASLAEHLIKWLCPEKGLVVDPFGGYATTAWAAEKNARRWATCEIHWEYLRAALSRFSRREGYCVNPLYRKLDDEKIRSQMVA